tara:strand:+ start:2450 stop:5281 length:2832 start_codon:yes stop_codon:yes gene_type:complete
MAENPLSGHTAANITNASDGLRDNDQILSASLTNMLEGVHGNGILLLDDTAAGGGNRNTPQNLSGAVAKHSAYQVTIKGGFTILDGILYKFADGYSGASPASITVDLTKASGNLHKRTGETYNALTAGQECLFTIYLSSDTDSKHVQFVQSAAVSTGTGVYPVSDTTYLTEPDTGNSVKQSVVLATVRAVFNDSESLGNDGLKINITEVNDKRVFVRPSPIYLSPVTPGAVASNDTVNSALKLDEQYTGQHGDLNASSLGAVWMSKSSTKTTGGGTQLGAVGDDVVFLSLNEGGSRKTARLAPDKLYTDSNWTDTTNYFTFDGPNAFLLAPQQANTYLYPDNDSADFPAGHLVYVKNTLSSGDAFQYENNGADFAIAAGASAIFVRTTSNTAGQRWQKLISSTGGGSGAIAAATSGSADRVATFGGADSLVGETLLTFNATDGLKVGASGNGADLTLYSATADNVGVVWDHDGQTNGTLTLGANDYGIDFKAFGDTASKYIEWDASADTFKVAGTLDIDGAVIVGVDDTGYDVKFFGATAGAYMLWDESQDDLILGGAARLGIGETAPSTQLHISGTAPTITIKNTGTGNADADQKGRIDFLDHSDTTFGRMQVSHDGSADDTKSDMILSVHDGSNLVEGMRIDSAKLATFAGAVTIGGDLTVNGTTTTVNSTTISVDDPIITIGGDVAPSSDDNKDRGVVFRWYDSGASAAKTGFFGYDDSSGHFVYLKDATVSNEVVTTTINTANLGTIRANFDGDLRATTVNCIGDLIVDADTSNSDNVPDSPYAFMVDVSEHEVLLGATSKMGINQASPKASIHVSGTAFEFADNTGITSNSDTGVVEIPICPKGDFRAVEALLSTFNSTDNANFETTKILIIHDGTNSHHTVYGTINDAGSTSATHTYDVTIPSSGGNQDKICITIDYAQISGNDKDFVTKISWIGVE